MIHAYQMGGQNIVCDVESGAVHLLDDIAFSLVTRLTPPLSAQCPGDAALSVAKELGCSPDEVRAAYDELFALSENDLLFAEPVPVNVSAYQMTSAPVKALCLHVSHDCNLRCAYCFASTGDFGLHNRSLMSPETGKKAIDFVIKKSTGRRNIEIDFFGGEPLMAFDTVHEVVEYAKEQGKLHKKEFRFTITTNGMLLDDRMTEYINREMSNVVLSLDGRPEINDKLRFRVDGSGSYDRVVPKFQKLVSERGPKDYYIRGTFTRNNKDFTADVLHMAKIGFREISVEPVVAGADAPYSLREEDLDEIKAQYETLAFEMLERSRGESPEERFHFFHFNVDLEQGPCVIKRLRGCGAGLEYLAVTPEGDLYPCHQFVGMEEFKLGNLDSESLNRDVSARFARQNIHTREDCPSCWAKYYCSGGCSASNHLMNGDLSKPYAIGCELERKRLECAIFLKAAAAE